MSVYFMLTVLDERRTELIDIFGTNRLPVTNSAPELTALSGAENEVWCFFLDLTRITPAQHRNLVAHLVRKFNSKPADVESTLQRIGLPLVVGECDVHVCSTEVTEQWRLN
jgi:hypothetical protein